MAVDVADMSETEAKASSNKDRAAVEEAILRTLRTYPRVSATMLGGHVRPYSSEWRFILEELVDQGVVLRLTNTVGRRHVFVYTLPVEDAVDGASIPTS